MIDKITYEMLDPDCDGQRMQATYSDGISAEIVARYHIEYHDDPDYMHPEDYAEMILDCAELCAWDVQCEIEEREQDMIARDKSARFEL